MMNNPGREPRDLTGLYLVSGFRSTRSALVVGLMAMAVLVAGCTPQATQALSNAAGQLGRTASALRSGVAGKLLLFGGPNHDTYLGCLNCSEYSSESVLNEFSSYGSEFSSTSIHNSVSQYGSEFSNYSACSTYASDPPVIVDEQGNYYGRLTVNPYADQVDSERLIRWLASVCQE